MLSMRRENQKVSASTSMVKATAHLMPSGQIELPMVAPLQSELLRLDGL